MLQINYTIIEKGIKGAADPSGAKGANMSKENFADIIIDRDIAENGNNSNFEYMPMFNGLFNIGKDGSGYIFSLEDNAADNKKVIALIGFVSDFIPYLKTELNKPENAKIKLYKVLLCLDYKELQDKDKNARFILFAKDPKTAAGKIITSALDAQKLVNQQARAADARKIQKEKQEQAQTANNLRYIAGETLQVTNTKLANEFFSITPPITEIDGQLTLNTVYANKAGQNIAVLSYYNFNEKFLKAHGIQSRNFTDFDYFVAMVCNNLFLENNRQVSLTKIWHEMGNPKNPNPRQLQELREALLKGLSTIMHISNKEVLDAWNVDTETYHDIESPVIPVQILTERNRANGYITNETINIFGLSPFILVADPLNQITTWDKQVLKLYPGSRSARYWRVMRYLMQQIAWMRNDNARSNRITPASLCEAVGDKTRADKQRTLKLTYELLEKVFKPLDYISSYNEDKNGNIVLKYNKDRKPKLNPGNGKNQK